jgi:hypothetical protein
MKTLYLAADGDDVGRKIEFFIVMNQTRQLSDFSDDYQAAMVWFSEKLSNNFGAKIIFKAGDSLLACSLLEEFSLNSLEQLRIEFCKLSHATISFGIGNSPRQAYFALKLAKASGKNRIEIFQEYGND